MYLLNAYCKTSSLLGYVLAYNVVVISAVVKYPGSPLLLAVRITFPGPLVVERHHVTTFDQRLVKGSSPFTYRPTKLTAGLSRSSRKTMPLSINV